MSGCNGILFFFDPKVLGAELVCQAHVASFVNMLEKLAPSRPAPDPGRAGHHQSRHLEGFQGESQVVLVSPEDERYLSEDFESFLDRVLSVTGSLPTRPGPARCAMSSSGCASSSRSWSVAPRFQIFFTSNTGQTRNGSARCRPLYYAPPQDSADRRARTNALALGLDPPQPQSLDVSPDREVRGTICFLWIALYSAPHRTTTSGC